MKKLMIAAAAAAMASGAFAITQVYDMRINLKTTECKDITLRANQNPFVPAGGQIAYRDVSTLTLAGMIWACDCEYIQDLGQALGGGLPEFRYYTWASTATYNPAARQTAQSGSEGYIFWNVRTGAPWGYSTITKPAATAADATTWTIPGFTASTPGPSAVVPGGAGNPMPTFTWWFLQRIGSRAEKVEGVWELLDNYSGFFEYDLIGAGFGTARMGTVNTTANLVGMGAVAGTAVNGLNECGEAIITSMTGNVAGNITQSGNNGGCVFCGVVNCVAFPFCNCASSLGVANTTAAFGTWTLRYNQQLSRRLLANGSIRDCFRFSAETADMIQFLEANTRRP